jgi:hypothetical protein
MVVSFCKWRGMRHTCDTIRSLCARCHATRRAYEAGEAIRQETRLWDEKEKATRIMRVKEVNISRPLLAPLALWGIDCLMNYKILRSMSWWH